MTDKKSVKKQKYPSKHEWKVCGKDQIRKS